LIVDLNLPWRKAALKPLIMEKMKAKRFFFAQKYRSWTREMWVKAMVSDKSTFRILRVVSRNIRWSHGQDHETPSRGHVLGLFLQRYWQGRPPFPAFEDDHE
jgi:hypothetical protein